MNSLLFPPSLVPYTVTNSVSLTITQGSAFITFWSEGDAFKALTSSVFDAEGTKLHVSIPMAPKKQQETATYEGEYHDDKLFVSGIPNQITQTEMVCVFAQFGDVEVEMKPKNTAIVSYWDKRHAAHALSSLHKRFSFPGSTRSIYVRFAQKFSNDATSAKLQPKQKLTMVAWSLNFA